MSKPRRQKEERQEDLEPTFGERIVAPPLVLRVRRWLREEYERLVPINECYERVAVRIFQEGLELEVLKLSRGDFYRETLATSPRAVFDRLGAQEVLWGFWKPAGWKPPRRRSP
jgi:hypothetical protein